MVKITGFNINGTFYAVRVSETHLKYCLDVRFPTSLTGDGTDAM